MAWYRKIYVKDLPPSHDDDDDEMAAERFVFISPLCFFYLKFEYDFSD